MQLLSTSGRAAAVSWTVLLCGCGEPATEASPGPSAPAAAASPAGDPDPSPDRARAGATPSPEVPPDALEDQKILLAILMLDAESPGDAAQIAREVLRSNPASEKAHLVLALACMTEGPEHDLPRALEHASRAEGFGHTMAWVWKAQLEWLTGDHHGADRTMGARSPEQIGALPGLNRCELLLVEWRSAMAKGDVARAERARDYLEQEPVFRKQEPPHGIRALKRLLALERGAGVAAVDLRLAKGEPAEAAELARTLVQSFPDCKECRAAWARALEAAGDADSAAEQRRARDLLARLDEGTSGTELSLEEIDELATALRALAPVSPRLPLLRARALLSLGEHQLAAQVSQDFRGQTPEATTKLTAEAWYVEGQARRSVKQLPEAIACFEAAAKLDESYQPALRLLRLDMSQPVSGSASTDGE